MIWIHLKHQAFSFVKQLSFEIIESNENSDAFLNEIIDSYKKDLAFHEQLYKRGKP